MKTAIKSKKRLTRGNLISGFAPRSVLGGQVIYHYPVVWVADTGFIFQKDKTLPLGVFEEDCIFRHWAIEALEKAGIKYRIVYVSRSISGILDAVRAGLAIAPVVQSNVPSDLKIVGIEEGLPVLPVSNIVLHKVTRPLSETIECFANHLIKSFREKI